MLTVQPFWGTVHTLVPLGQTMLMLSRGTPQTSHTPAMFAPRPLTLRGSPLPTLARTPSGPDITARAPRESA